MSSDDQTQIVQCVGCNSKLRIGAKAIGKTIACPKCGQHLKIKDQVAPKPERKLEPERKLVVAKPVSGPTAQGPAMAAPAYQNSAYQNSAYQSAAAGNDWNTPAFAPGATYQPYAAQPKKSGKSQMWIWIAVGGVAALLFLGVTVTLLVILWGAKPAGSATAANNPARPPADGPVQPQLKTDTPSPANATAPTNANTTPSIPSGRTPAGARTSGQARYFTDLGPPRPFGQSIVWHRAMVSRTMQTPLMLNIFIPKGEHADKSLPVMFESPSGTILLHGADIEMPRPSSEYLPFTEAGMITVTFAIDGDMPRSLTPDAGAAYMLRLQKAYKQFIEADAGVTNGKLAIDYVLEKVPAADPKRLYIWGHSSAATLSLLMASKDPRLSKCIAMAPVTDLRIRLDELLQDRSMEKFLPNLPEYFKTGSPITYVRDLKCPVFVAHAKDDDNEPFKNTQTYVKSLRDAGGNVTFEEPASGGHYQELLDAAVPKAVEWLKAN